MPPPSVAGCSHHTYVRPSSTCTQPDSTATLRHAHKQCNCSSGGVHTKPPAVTADCHRGVVTFVCAGLRWTFEAATVVAGVRSSCCRRAGGRARRCRLLLMPFFASTQTL
eukprot:317010-Chlamydomonas_euryale.AAC.2